MAVSLILSWFAFLFVSGVGGQQDFSISPLQRDSETEESLMQKPRSQARAPVSTRMVQLVEPHSEAAVKPAAASVGKPKLAHAGAPKKTTAAKLALAKVEKPQEDPKPKAAKLEEPKAVKAKAAEPEAPQQKPQVSANTAVGVVSAESAKSSDGVDIGKQISGPISKHVRHADITNITNLKSSTKMTAAVRVQHGEEVDVHSTDAASVWEIKKAAKEAGMVKYQERQKKMWEERKAMDASIENARLHPTEAPSAESIYEKRHAQKALALHRWEEEQQKAVEEQKAKVEERKAKEEERKAKEAAKEVERKAKEQERKAKEAAQEAAKEAAREYARLHPTEAPSPESIWEKRLAKKNADLKEWQQKHQ